MAPWPAILPLALCTIRAFALRSRREGGEVSLGFVNSCTWYTRKPTLCQQNNALWSEEELLAAVPAFAEVYRNRQPHNNDGGVGVNHAFALWFTVQKTKPKYIIESGAHLGGSLYLLRKAAPEARIFSIDPREEGFTNLGPNQPHFHDNSSKTVYFRGKQNFKDFAAIDWDSLIPKDERNDVLVMLDDHMSSLRRSKEMLERGFRALWYDDNWINGDTYSFNKLCAPREPVDGDMVLIQDNFGREVHKATLEEHSENVAWMQNHLEVYFEFPALYDGCTNHTRRHSLLTEQELKGQGLPPVKEDWQHYQHLYAPYVRLRQ